MKIAQLKIGQEFTMVLKNSHGQSVHTAGSYRKHSDNEVRCTKDCQVWTLSDCGLSTETEVTGQIWG
jgi:hypothetical protein